ncbi:MAG: hypothetical protein K0U24_06305 [Gammaproteobacteria bacterium]|nr:hypothetical protein [Gammaproteobacteria bacterium]MCH9716641.1 hypothetical protein [Gammaproteobacteria bacterium]MCH9763816.1 hypothetical protein [Gammaproteobacteria bacterium]
MYYDYLPANLESEYTSKAGLTSDVLKATKAQQKDKAFIIQAVSRQAYVTEIRRLRKPVFALDEWDWESNRPYELPYREYELQHVAKQFKDDIPNVFQDASFTPDLAIST